MSARVTVDLGSEGPVAIKNATGAAAAAALDNEADRLRRAAHPGVVRLVDLRPSPDGGALVTAFAGEPVARWHGDLPMAAGVCAAVATTLADLHRIGVVHGRVDGTHVLIGGDGRPRLCGFSDPGEATPSDDVAAVGRLLDELMGASAGSKRPRTARWLPGASGERRALARVVARATDPLPTRRPSARGLASSILAAIPHADLPGRDARSRPGDADELPPGIPAASLPDDRQGPRQYDDFWDARVARCEGSVDEWLADADPAEDANQDPAEGDDQDPAERDDQDPAEGDDQDPAQGANQDLAEGDDQDPADQPDDPLAGWGGAGPTTPMPAWSHRPEGEPHRPSHRRTRRAIRSGRGALLAGVAGAACLAVAAVGRLTILRPASAARETGSGAGAVETIAGRACPYVTAPTVDLDGDGCADAFHVAGGIIEGSGGARWKVGQPGDQIAVGDWDCDGVASPAVLRPATGDVFVFPGWAEAGAPQTVAPLARVAHGRALQAAETGGSCHALVVRRADGTSETVTPAR